MVSRLSSAWVDLTTLNSELVNFLFAMSSDKLLWEKASPAKLGLCTAKTIEVDIKVWEIGKNWALQHRNLDVKV